MINFSSIMRHLPEPSRKLEEFVPVPHGGNEREARASTADIGYSAPYSLNERESGGVLEYCSILRRRIGTLISIAIIGTAAGFLVTLPRTPIYQVHTSVEVVGFNQDFLNIKGSNPLNDEGSSADTAEIQTQLKILQSDALVDRVVAKLRNDTAAAREATQTPGWRKLLNRFLQLRAPKDAAVAAREQAISYAADNYKVRASNLTRIIDVTVDSTSPQTATEFANALTREFIDQNLEARWQTTQHTSDWLANQLNDMRTRLNRSENRLQAYASEAGVLFSGDQQKNNVSQEKLLQLQQALSAAQSDRISKQARWEMANSNPAEALPDVLNDPTLRDYQAKLTELKRQLAELHAIYTDDSPKVQRVQSQLATLDAALNTERADILKRIKNEHDEALRRESLLTADYAAQRAIVTGESEKAVQYDIMKHEVESSRQLYDALLQQLKQATLASALRASNIRVVDPAKLPKHPYKPSVPISTLMGLFGGVFLGAAFVIVQDRSDRTIQHPGQTQFLLNLRELGIVPTADSSGWRRLGYFGGLGPKRSVAVQENVPRKDSLSILPAIIPRVELSVWQRTHSAVAESFRAALVSIMFSGKNGSRPRVFVVASAGPFEGKSTVVSNLGIAGVEVNQRVLLIDADLRRPRLHDVFNLGNDNGLSDLLRSKESLATVLGRAIQQTKIPDLCVLTSGSQTSAATSLLFSPRMPELLQLLRTEFEAIFIDTPPMLQIPDARVLGRMADRVIMVVRAGKTTRDDAMAARKLFGEDGTPMLGTILNDWDPDRSGNGSYEYHYTGAATTNGTHPDGDRHYGHRGSDD